MYIILLFSFVITSDYCESSKILVDGNNYKDNLLFSTVVDVKESKLQDKAFHQNLKKSISNILLNKLDEFGMCFMQDVDLGESLDKKLIQYIKNKKTSNNSLRSKMKNMIDLLFHIKISNSNKVNKDFIEIKLLNSNPDKIKVSGILAKHKIKGIDFAAQKDELSNTFEQFILDFLNKYFLASVAISDIDLDENFKIIVNGKEKDQYAKDEKNIIVYDVPRNIKSYVQVESKSYISKKYYINPRPLYLLQTNKAFNTNEFVNCLCDNNDLDPRCKAVCQREEMIFEVREKFPIAKLDISDYKGDRIINLLPELKIFNFTNKDKIQGIYKDGIYFLESKYEGEYLATMKNDNFASPFPFLIQFDDSSNYNRNIKTYKKIDLYKISKPIAHSLNVLFPGAGLFYAKDKNWMSSIHLSTYFTTIALAYNSYDSFLDYRDSYESALIVYQNESSLENKNNVKSKYNLTKKSKDEFRTYVGLSLIINVLSNYYLDKLFKGKLKW